MLITSLSSVFYSMITASSQMTFIIKKITYGVVCESHHFCWGVGTEFLVPDVACETANWSVCSAMRSEGQNTVYANNCIPKLTTVTQTYHKLEQCAF